MNVIIGRKYNGYFVSKPINEWWLIIPFKNKLITEGKYSEKNS